MKLQLMSLLAIQSLGQAHAGMISAYRGSTPLSPVTGRTGSLESSWRAGSRFFDGSGLKSGMYQLASSLASVPVPDVIPVPRPALSPAPELAAAGEDGSGRGSPPTPPNWLNALQKHVAFFDKNGDGIITYSETVAGLSELGVGWAMSRVTALFINLNLGRSTTGRWTTDVDVANIAAGIHGSDTGVFDADGNYNEAAFRRLFDLFDRDRSGTLNEIEINEMIDANSKERPGAWLAAKLEWRLLLDVAADAQDWVDGKPVRAISAKSLLSLYDGTLFENIAAARRKPQ